MIFSAQIQEQFAQAFGQPLRYPGDYEALAEDVCEKTGQPVSVNTLKRLFGVIGPEVEPRRSTLDILAQYLGGTDWQSYMDRLSGAGNSDFETDSRNVDGTQLPVGAHVSFRYLPDRFVALTHLGDGLYRVLRSENSKLQSGDVITVRNFCPGYPLTADSVIRKGENLGTLVAGKIAGLNDLQIKEHGEL